MFSLRRSVLPAVLAVLTAAGAANADLKCSKTATYKVKAAAKPKIGPRLKFDGEGPVTGEEKGGKLIFTAKLNDIDMGERNKHTRKYFRIKKDSEAKLTVDRGALKIPDDKKSVSGVVQGKLQLNGKEKPVKVKYKAKRSGSEFEVSDTSFTFKYTDFGIEEICEFVGTICVEPEVTITVDKMTLKDNK
ncbi:MAG TPA: YceI family protein [Polyangiaceae bacterium]|nr:YceI family protein [Polyangiaceae bacterium]